MNNDDGDGKDYKVGYSRPPRATRFKPGQSGNPRGRPKGALTTKALLLKILEEKVPVMEGGRRRMMTRREVMVRAASAKAMKGDAKMFAELSRIGDRVGAFDDAELFKLVSPAEDQEIIERFLNRAKPADEPDPES